MCNLHQRSVSLNRLAEAIESRELLSNRQFAIRNVTIR